MVAVKLFFRSRWYNVVFALLLFGVIWDCMGMAFRGQSPARLFCHLLILLVVVCARITDLVVAYIRRKRH
jgi:hypothetical protein